MKLRVYNPTLDPNLWEDKALKPEVKEALLKVAQDFYDSTDLKGEFQNILFFGSSANYNWTPTSDIDLHIVVDIAAQNITPDYARKFMDGLACQWNTNHDIEIKGHPVEVYIQDIGEPNSTPDKARPGASIYSVFDDKWLLEPNPQNIQIDADKLRKKYFQMKDKIENLLKTEDITKLKALMKSIKNYRDAGLAEGGEFSVENLVFKCLRHTGLLGQLKEAITKIYDRKASLPEGGNIQSPEKTTPFDPLKSGREMEQKMIRETDEPNFILVGFVNRELEIISEKDYVGNKVNHEILLKSHPEFHWETETVVFWRYKKANNTLYWGTSPTEEQRFAVIEYLHKHVKATLPHQKVSHLGHDPEASKVDEGKDPFIYTKLVGWIFS